MKNIKLVFVFSLINLVLVIGAVLFLKTNSVKVSRPSSSCIVTVDGNKYDLLEFITLHSGGDIFKCGTDMSTEFHSQHPNGYLEQIAKYKL